MRIGRDHVASAVNTLVLAYAGASLPLLLLFSLSGRSLGDVATSQDVATEIVRTLVGSIGLVASVPVTTAVAALVASREREEPEDGTGRAGVASPSRSRSSSVSRPLNAARSSPGRCPERSRSGVDLGQHGDREQPARGQRGDEVGVPARVAEQLAHHHVVRPAAAGRQAGVQVVGDPADPIGDPGCSGEPRTGGQPDRGDVDGVDGEPAPGQPHGDPAAPAGHVQGASGHGEARGELGRARQDARRSHARRPRSGVPGIPPDPVVAAHAHSRRARSAMRVRRSTIGPLTALPRCAREALRARAVSDGSLAGARRTPLATLVRFAEHCR